jgi:hypothetical protein
VHDRSAETIIGLIKQWILPGTTVITDCWAAYSFLLDEGYVHFAVNHSVTFVDETTGAHTNMIESTWKKVKALLSPYNHKADYVSFAECMFSRNSAELLQNFPPAEHRYSELLFY